MPPIVESEVLKEFRQLAEKLSSRTSSTFNDAVRNYQGSLWAIVQNILDEYYGYAGRREPNPEKAGEMAANIPKTIQSWVELFKTKQSKVSEIAIAIIKLMSGNRDEIVSALESERRYQTIYDYAQLMLDDNYWKLLTDGIRVDGLVGLVERSLREETYDDAMAYADGEIYELQQQVEEYPSLWRKFNKVYKIG